MEQKFNIKNMEQKENISLCIPRMEANVPKDYIYDKIKNLKIGHIQKMTETPHRNDPSLKRILMRISYNEKNKIKINNLESKLEEHGSIKYVYNMPWYWKIVATHS